MTEKKGLKGLDKYERKYEPKKIEEEAAKKIDWGKILKLIYKILEPEIKKLPKYYILIPVSILYFEIFGMYRTIEILINLFK